MTRSRFVVFAGVVAGLFLVGGAVTKGAIERCPAGEPGADYFRVEAMNALIDAPSSRMLARLDPEAVRAQRASRSQLERYVRDNPDCCIYGGRSTGELTPVSFLGRVQGRGKHVISIKLEPMPEAAPYEHVRFNRCGQLYTGE